RKPSVPATCWRSTTLVRTIRASAVGTSCEGLAAFEPWKRRSPSESSKTVMAASASTLRGLRAESGLGAAEVDAAMGIRVEVFTGHQLAAEGALGRVREPRIGDEGAVWPRVGPVGEAVVAHAAGEAEQRGELRMRGRVALAIGYELVVERLAGSPCLLRDVEPVREDRLAVGRDLRV